MTDKEFEKELKKSLEVLPEEFHVFVIMDSWNRGHSAGREETLSIAQEIIWNLEKPINKYTERLKNELGNDKHL